MSGSHLTTLIITTLLASFNAKYYQWTLLMIFQVWMLEFSSFRDIVNAALLSAILMTDFIFGEFRNISGGVRSRAVFLLLLFQSGPCVPKPWNSPLLWHDQCNFLYLHLEDCFYVSIYVRYFWKKTKIVILKTTVQWFLVTWGKYMINYNILLLCIYDGKQICIS